MSAYDSDWSGLIGYKGEKIVASLLPYAHFHNERFELHLPYDITWKKIHIDVKTCSSVRRGYGGTWAKGRTNRTAEDDIIFVHVLSIDEGTYFWVNHSANKFLTYAHIKDSLEETELPNAITDCYKKYSPIYKKSVDRQQSLELL